MTLRTDLDRNDRKQAIRNCEEIIKNYKDDPHAGGNNKKNQGLFAIIEQEDEAAKKQRAQES